MQTFLPYDSFEESASVLDWKRLGKQRVEAMQIVNAIEKQTGWRHHPVVHMWTPYIPALKHYTNVMIEEWIKRGYNKTKSFIPLIELTYFVKTTSIILNSSGLRIQRIHMYG